MERGKFSLIKPNNDWRSRFQRLIETQLDMERKWDQMKDKDGFAMKKVNISTLGDHEADEADSVNIVVCVITFLSPYIAMTSWTTVGIIRADFDF